MPHEQSPNPITRYGGKESEGYRYFASDFLPNRERHWQSLWLQAQVPILFPDVMSVLEFGGGRDVTRSLARHFGIDYRSVDISDRFFPDVVSSIADYPFTGEQVDLVSSFQCLEHNDWEEVPALIGHMAKFSRRYVYLSVPYSGGWFSLSLSLRLPKIHWEKAWHKVFDGWGSRRVDVDAIKARPPERRRAAHWWEVGRPGLTRRQMIDTVEAHGLELVSCSHNPLFPHHMFLLLRKPG